MSHSVLGKRQKSTPPLPFLELVEQACHIGRSQSQIDQIQQALKTSDRMKLLKKQTEDFRTPLMIAAEAGSTEVVTILLDAGAPVDGRECLIYRTPLQQAANKGHAAVVALLLARGADPKAEVWRNVTTLDIAVKGGHADTITLIREAIAKAGT